MYIAAAKNQHIDEVIKAWPGLKTKAAVTPSTMADFGSVAVLADDIVRIIAPTSAFAALVANGSVSICSRLAAKNPGTRCQRG